MTDALPTPTLIRVAGRQPAGVLYEVYLVARMPSVER
jgi:hypothetical protein